LTAAPQVVGRKAIVAAATVAFRRGVRDAGTTVLLVEQNVNEALEIADRGYVLETGLVTHQGPGAALLEDPRVREAYLGL
jgi:branched-chain amino acid transport system ATP-binding protein